ncbi:glycine cleavage system aminomethyltransferase GcvT [bacterium]|nr:glycine cleavage system aminomethyltransferase GcvT [bacterium]
MSEVEVTKATSLNENHKALGARMVPFAGYEMPVIYSSIKEEHSAVRENVGLFDVSHMGIISIEGSDALSSLEFLTVNNVASLLEGQVQYSAICNEKGGLVDDVLVYNISENHFRIVANASNKEAVLSHLISNSEGDIKIKAHWSDSLQPENLSLIAVQGPKAMNLMNSIVPGVIDVKPFYSQEFSYEGVQVRVSRTGYTGEDGVEFSIPNSSASQIWNELLQKGEGLGVKACGLGSRDTLRLEAGLSLYGHELNDTQGPFESGIGWIVNLEKDFLGKAKVLELKDTGASTIGVELVGKGIPREGYPVLGDGRVVGKISSGTQSPTLKKAIAMAVVDCKLKIGTPIQIEIRNKPVDAVVCSRRFYKK